MKQFNWKCSQINISFSFERCRRHFINNLNKSENHCFGMAFQWRQCHCYMVSHIPTPNHLIIKITKKNHTKMRFGERLSAIFESQSSHILKWKKKFIWHWHMCVCERVKNELQLFDNNLEKKEAKIIFHTTNLENQFHFIFVYVRMVKLSYSDVIVTPLKKNWLPLYSREMNFQNRKKKFNFAKFMIVWKSKLF